MTDHVGWAPPTDDAHCDVERLGPGMSQRRRPSIFELGARVGQHGGWGIGRGRVGVRFRLDWVGRIGRAPGFITAVSQPAFAKATAGTPLAVDARNLRRVHVGMQTPLSTCK